MKILQLVGVPAYHEGVTLHLPTITLEVARACSGVNYLIAVLALGLPLGYLYLPSLPRRAILIVSAVIIAAVSNSLRVALIGMLAYWEIGSPLHGPFHVLHGLFVSGIGYVVLFAGLRMLTPRPQGTGQRALHHRRRFGSVPLAVVRRRDGLSAHGRLRGDWSVPLR